MVRQMGTCCFPVAVSGFLDVGTARQKRGRFANACFSLRNADVPDWDVKSVARSLSGRIKRLLVVVLRWRTDSAMAIPFGR